MTGSSTVHSLPPFSSPSEWTSGWSTFSRLTPVEDRRGLVSTTELLSVCVCVGWGGYVVPSMKSVPQVLHLPPKQVESDPTGEKNNSLSIQLSFPGILNWSGSGLLGVISGSSGGLVPPRLHAHLSNSFIKTNAASRPSPAETAAAVLLIYRTSFHPQLPLRRRFRRLTALIFHKSHP